jgi:hypothetical protein
MPPSSLVPRKEIHPGIFLESGSIDRDATQQCGVLE